MESLARKDKLWVLVNSMTGAFDLGRTIHGELIKRPIQGNMAVQTALLTMYAKCGSIEAAKSVFNIIEERDVIAWGSMIAGLCQNGKFVEALNLFQAMQVEQVMLDSTIMVSIINACNGTENVELGFQIHGHAIKKAGGLDVYVSCALIDMYAHCGLSGLAGSVFSSMTCKNIVAWNSIISCYAQNNCPDLAIELFVEILKHGLVPDSISVTSVIVAVSSLAALLKGKTIHAFYLRHGIQSDLRVDNALLDIHSGLVEVGHRYFQAMSQDYGIIPTMDHYATVVDLYGRAGRLDEAYSFIQSMPIEPDESIWLCLLSSCRAYRRVKLGELAANQLLKADPERSGNYVQLLNLYGEVGFWEKAADLRVLMKEKGLKKSPGRFILSMDSGNPCCNEESEGEHGGLSLSSSYAKLT
ncbi:hypothetical protein ACLOJK_031473 [Asimina triloba]